MITKTIEFFQTGGADETLEAAKAKHEAAHPDELVLDARFVAAYPGDREGRWVTIELDCAC